MKVPHKRYEFNYILLRLTIFLLVLLSDSLPQVNKSSQKGQVESNAFMQRSTSFSGALNLYFTIFILAVSCNRKQYPLTVSSTTELERV